MKDALFRRDIRWLCQRYYRKHTPVGRAAARLMAAPTPDVARWQDLKLVIEAVWTPNCFGFYTSTIHAQSASINLARDYAYHLATQYQEPA